MLSGVEPSEFDFALGSGELAHGRRTRENDEQPFTARPVGDDAIAGFVRSLFARSLEALDFRVREFGEDAGAVRDVSGSYGLDAEP